MPEFDPRAPITFRPVVIDTDVELIFAWLGDEDVHRWYRAGEHTIENYRHRFGTDAGVHRFIIEIGSAPIGYLQAYQLDTDVDYMQAIGLDGDTIAFDLFIGDAAYRNRGWGSAIVKAATERIGFGIFDAPIVCINPAPNNLRAIRSYEKAGFRRLRTVWVESEDPEDTGYEVVMIRERATENPDS